LGDWVGGARVQAGGYFDAGYSYILLLIFW
jgi:hypothetical protein